MIAKYLSRVAILSFFLLGSLPTTAEQGYIPIAANHLEVELYCSSLPEGDKQSCWQSYKADNSENNFKDIKEFYNFAKGTAYQEALNRVIGKSAVALVPKAVKAALPAVAKSVAGFSFGVVVSVFDSTETGCGDNEYCITSKAQINLNSIDSKLAGTLESQKRCNKSSFIDTYNKAYGTTYEFSYSCESNFHNAKDLIQDALENCQALKGSRSQKTCAQYYANKSAIYYKWNTAFRMHEAYQDRLDKELRENSEARKRKEAKQKREAELRKQAQMKKYAELRKQAQLKKQQSESSTAQALKSQQEVRNGQSLSNTVLDIRLLAK